MTIMYFGRYRIWWGQYFVTGTDFIHLFLRGYEKGSPNVISTVIEDDEGNILAGLVDGGLAIRRRGSRSFRFYRHVPGDSPFFVA